MTDIATVFSIWAYHGDGGDMGNGPIIGYTSTEQSAKDKAKGRGWYGGNGAVTKHKAIKIHSLDDTVFVLADEHPIDLDGISTAADEHLRKEAIKKLTNEELRVLGVKND